MRVDQISIILPVKNEAANIRSFLSSLPMDAHLIAVDSGTDGTGQIILQERPHNSQVIYLDCNVTGARQYGAVNAETEWLLFTDADIRFSPDYFLRLFKLAQADAYFGTKTSLFSFIPYYRWFSRGQKFLSALGIPAVTGSNLLIKTEVFWQIGGFDLDLNCNEDSEIGWRIRRKGYAIQFVPQLAVIATDQRRLKTGVFKKIIHSLARCTLLYLNLLPRSLKTHDWGYWPG